MRVIKRSGKKEDYCVEKIHKMVETAIGDIPNVFLSEIEMNANLSLYDGITSREINKVLIKSANDLISEDRPNYQQVAANLLNIELRKDVWKGSVPPSLKKHVNECIDKGIYDVGLRDKHDYDKLEQFIQHDRDNRFTYSGLQQLVDKYLIKNRSTGEIFETPQFVYMGVAATLFEDIGDVKIAYDQFSRFKISLPTPVMAGVRSTIKQYSSCVLTDVGDSLDSIFASVHAVGKYTARRAGIGLNVGRIRPINSSIRGGEVLHTGLIPYLKTFESAVKATSQNGLRGGGATVYIPFWHEEVEDALVLKNNSGTDDNRVRKLDYALQFNRLFYDRFLKNENITLFNSHEVPDLYDNFGNNVVFEKLYKKYEKSGISTKSVNARKLAEVYARERLETGRIYSMNIDHCNSAGSWNIPVSMSNLCVEITQPTKPIQNIDDPAGEIGICVLSALNLLEIKSDKELEIACDVAVKTLESIITYQEYPVKAGENFCINRRSLGIGLTNYAGWLAKNKLEWGSTECLKQTHEVAEKLQWYLLNASCKLAEELGPCAKFSDTKYADGLLPIDWYNKEVDNLVAPEYIMDWEELRDRIKQHGLRHSTLTAFMPCESSSVVQNSTNGTEPIRSIITYKKAKNGVLKQVAPNSHNRKKYYNLAWDFTTNKPIIEVAAVFQKFIDMSMSLNLYYNYQHYPDSNIPLSVVLQDQLYSYKLGIKTLYYANSPDGDGLLEGCDGGGCSI